MNKRFARGRSMLVFVLVVICVAAWSGVNAAEQKFACREEIAQYCKGVKPGGGRILTCLKEHESALSPGCREKFTAIVTYLEEAKRICATDIEKFCGGVQPGEGRIARCLKGHVEEISPGCREKVYGTRKMIEKNASEQ
jgi:hypothetical protein